MDRPELEAKAVELGIEVSDEQADSELEDLIKLKEDDKIDENKKKEEDKKEDPIYLRDELDKVIRQRDTNKTERRKLQTLIDKLEDNLDNSPKKEDFDTLSEELESLKDFKQNIDDANEEKQLADATDLEREQIRNKKEVSGFQKQLDEFKELRKSDREESTKEKENMQDTISRLRTRGLSAEIAEHAATNKAFNPNQIVRILKDEFTYDKDLDKFVSFVRDSKNKIIDELDVADRVKEFLTSDENENLLKSDVKKGMGHKPGSSDSKKIEKRDDSIYDPTDPKIIADAESRGLSPEDHIYTLELRDDKKKIIAENRIKGTYRR